MSYFLTIIDEAVVCLKEDDTVAWSNSIDDIILIAEYTTNEGAWGDDDFVVFVTMEDGQALFSRYCGLNINEVLSELGQRFDYEMRLQLGVVGEWASRIIWPPPLAGCEYFTFTEAPEHTLWSKVRKCLFGAQFDYKPSEAVWNLITAEKVLREARTTASVASMAE